MQYDKTDPKSIEMYGKRLVGGSLSTVKGIHPIPDEETGLLVSGRTRGLLGGIVEKYYYDIQPENDGTPDFKEANVELKTTPIKRNTSGAYVAKERLVLGMIDYLAEAERDFFSSSYFLKNQKLMLLSYLHEENKTIGDVKFLLAKLYEFENLPKEDQKIIREDWEKINKKIKLNLAHELSEGDTMYLGACTKSATSANRRAQVNGPTAKPRAFSYKSSYMTQLLKRELGDVEDVERLLSEKELIEDKTFEQQVIDRFTPFVGKTTSQIADELGVVLKPKQLDKYAVLARAMMGVKKKKIEEFEAAGVRMKTIQLKADGTPKEHMSFSAFEYTELVKEVWDGDEEENQVPAEFQIKLESRFLFIVYRCQKKCLPEEARIFERAFFWTMPQSDFGKAHEVWKETIKLITEGKIVKNIRLNRSGEQIRETYFPSSQFNGVAHVRPHGKNALDVCALPIQDKFTGENVYTKHCFWLNKEYIKNILDEQGSATSEILSKPIPSPYNMEMVEIPLVGSAPCGEPLLGENNIEDLILVDKNKIKPGAEYFIVRASGDSMNKAGINDGDLVLCRYSEKGETGDRVVALIGGENVTIKYYDKRDGRRILLPKSTNSEHQPIIPDEGDLVQGVVQEVLKEPE